MLLLLLLVLDMVLSVSLILWVWVFHCEGGVLCGNAGAVCCANFRIFLSEEISGAVRCVISWVAPRSAGGASGLLGVFVVFVDWGVCNWGHSSCLCSWG